MIENLPLPLEPLQSLSPDTNSMVLINRLKEDEIVPDSSGSANEMNETVETPFDQAKKSTIHAQLILL
jgi:hypothetical protein